MAVERTLRIVQPVVALGDPHVNTDMRDRLGPRAALWDALVVRASDGRFEPALASGWSCAPDARDWTFSLRHDVRFHDGTPLTAEDVVASLRRASDADMRGEMATEGLCAGYLGDAEFSAPSANQVRVMTATPMADLLDLLVELAIVPATWRGDDGTLPPGTGAFRLMEHGDGFARMVASNDWWGGTPAADALEWRQLADPAARAELLLAGEADLATELDPASAARVDASGSATTISTPISTCVAFLLNAANGPCTDVRVRRALNLAIDVEELIAEAGVGPVVRTNGPLSPLHVGHDPAVAPYRPDPARARALLAEAGYRDGLALSVDVPRVLPNESLALADGIARQLAAVGVTLTVRVHEDRLAYARMVRAKQIADACCFDSSPLSTWRVLREKLHGGVAGPWWQGYANPEVDALIDSAATTPDDSARQALFRRAYRILHDDAPWFFLYSPEIVYGRGPALAGWQPGVNGVVRFGVG